MESHSRGRRAFLINMTALGVGLPVVHALTRARSAYGAAPGTTAASTIPRRSSRSR